MKISEYEELTMKQTSKDVSELFPDDERFSLLQEMARMPGNDHRKRYAIEKLKDYDEA